VENRENPSALATANCNGVNNAVLLVYKCNLVCVCNELLINTIIRRIP
jgi:hypothetical protein